MEIIQAVCNSNMAVAAVILLSVFIFYLALKGKIKSMGKYGVVFDDAGQALNAKLDTLTKTVVDYHTETLDKFKQQTEQLESYRKESLEGDKDLKMDMIRLQIISEYVDDHTKLGLYDKYKKLGGNSYIDVYMRKIKADTLAGMEEQ